ncbi:MAG: hypothetical protein HKN01_03630 [Acidimicrobiia bacterium]|nr:hypothetical protein [Acidimicrobiia bacterium]
MPTTTLPDYSGGSLVNLMAELEHRMTGSSPSPRLHTGIADLVPGADTYVLVLFDGLGASQLDHQVAGPLRESLATTIDAPFPSTTTVSLATVATGLPASQHGILGYQLWMPELDVVANTIHWTTLWGDALDIDAGALLPHPNLWQRLTDHNIEPITVQPTNFQGSSLSQALYRGCRFEGITTLDELVTATVDLAAQPGRLIFTYFPNVDFAAHVYGQESDEYGAALAAAALVWEQIGLRLPQGAVAVGTADHGHVDFAADRRIKIPKGDHDDREFYGDGRAMFVKGDGAALAETLPATWIPIDRCRHWWGPGPMSETAEKRLPDGILLADDDHVLLHRFSDDRMIGNHGALTDAERTIPLLVTPG